jgi:hypothetical protein
MNQVSTLDTPLLVAKQDRSCKYTCGLSIWGFKLVNIFISISLFLVCIALSVFEYLTSTIDNTIGTIFVGIFVNLSFISYIVISISRENKRLSRINAQLIPYESV